MMAYFNGIFYIRIRNQDHVHKMYIPCNSNPTIRNHGQIFIFALPKDESVSRRAGDVMDTSGMQIMRIYATQGFVVRNTW